MLDNTARKDNTSTIDLPDGPDSPPPPIRVNLGSFPAEITARPQWFGWRWVWRNGRWNKVTVWFSRNWKTGLLETWHIPSDHPVTWHAFEEVAEIIRMLNGRGGAWLGAGFRFTPSDPFCFVDIDHCIDPATRAIHPTAMSIVRRFNSYTEVTTGNHGLRIMIVGEKPILGAGEKPKCKSMIDGLAVEIYDKTQFSAVTGNRLELDGLSAKVEDRQVVLSAFYQELFPAGRDNDTTPRVYSGADLPPARPCALSDAWVINRLSSKPFWHGPNKSEQDLQLCNLIAYYVGPDPTRVEQILFASPARRPKWKRADYVARTIDRAIEYQSKRGGFYSDYLAQRDAELEAIGPADEAAVEALFAAGRAQREAARAATAATPTPAPAPTPAATVAELIASLTRPPSPDQIREDDQLRQAARSAAAAAHLDRPPPCTCGYKRSMFNPSTGTYRACHVLCGRWRCSTCNPKKKAQWSSHLRDVITTLPVPGGLPTDRRPRPETEPLYLARVRDDPRTTRRILKRIQRAGGQYARIKYTPGRQLVITTVPLSARDEPDILSPAVAAREAIQAVRDMLLYGDSRKPIFTSRGWKLPPRKPAGWTVVGDFPTGTTKSAIVEAMEDELDGTAEVRAGNPGLPFMPWVADCPLPATTTPDEDGTDQASQPSRLDLARAFHTRLANRVLGLPADEADHLTNAEIDQLFGVPATATASTAPAIQASP